MKKVVNSVLASALAASFVPAVVGAEEATQAPKMDPALEQVVKRLSALGLVAGYGNGEYGVDKPINRAEFATLIVRARGLEPGAKLAQFQSNFTDVKSSDWFAGFVNVASGEEIVKGYADKSFKPGNNVTYAEAVAMVIRALGYEPSVKGVWPNNYIAKASEIGIAKSITTPNNAATRGDVFKMLDNALNVDLMKQTEYGTDIRFEIQEDKTLLTEYLDVAVYDMDWSGDQEDGSEDLPFVSNVPVVGLGTLKANEVTFSGSGDTPSGTYKVADGIDANAFAGQHVQVWIKDDREDLVVWMEGSEDEDVLDETFDTFYFDGKIEDGETNKFDSLSKLEDLELKLGNSGKTYNFSKEVKVTYNFNRATSANETFEMLRDIIANNDTVVMNAKVVLDDEGDIAYLHAMDFASHDRRDNGVKYGSEVIEKIDSKNRIENLEGDSFTNLRDKEEGEDFLVFLNNQPAKFADLKPLDVYSVFYADGDRDKLIVMAYRNVVEGKVTDVEVRNKEDNRIKIGDKTYRQRKSSYSENANKDVSDDITPQELRDLEGEEVKIYLGGDGRIRHIETKDNVDDRTVSAIVTKSAYYDNKDDEYAFEVLTEKGTELKLSLDADDINGIEEEDIESTFIPEDGKPVVVEVSYDKDGKVKDVDYVAIADEDLNQLVDDEWEEAADEDDDTIEFEGDTYEVDSDTVVFDMTGEYVTKGERIELEDADIAKFKSLAEDDDNTVLFTVDGNDVEYIFVVDGDAIEGDKEYGYVKDFVYSGSKEYVSIVKKKEGGEVETVRIELDDDIDDAELLFSRSDFIAYSLNGNNQLIVDDAVVLMDGEQDLDPQYKTTITEDQDDWDEALVDSVRVARVDDFEDNTITYDDGTDEHKFVVGTSTIYLNSGFESEGGVDEGDYVVLIDTDDTGNKYDYVLIVAQDEDVEDEIGLKEKMDQEFLNQEPPVVVDPLVDADSITPTKNNFGPVFVYRVRADLATGVEAAEIEKVELEIDGEKIEGTIEGNQIEVNASGDFDVESATLIITPVEGNAQEFDVDFNE